MTILWCLVLSNELTADHFTLLCSLDMSIPNPPSLPVIKRNLNSINRDKCSYDISTYIATKPCLSAEQLNEFLCSLIDTHAPATQTRAPLHKSDPWYCEISDQLRFANRDRRKAERRWIPLIWQWTNKYIMQLKKQVTALVYSAKTTYFSTKITESTCKQLFGITSKLLSRTQFTPVPFSLPLDKLLFFTPEYHENM